MYSYMLSEVVLHIPKGHHEVSHHMGVPRMTVEEQHLIAPIVSELNRLKGRVDALEPYVSQLLELREQQYTIMNLLSLGSTEELQQRKAFVTQVRGCPETFK